MIIPKLKSTVDGIENLIISLYAKGMSNSDIEEQIRKLGYIRYKRRAQFHAL